MTHSKARNPYHLLRRWSSTRGIYDLQSCDSDWILRVVARICRVDAQGRIKWQTEIPSETVAMHLPLVVTNGLAVTATKGEDMRYSLQAYDTESGSLAWSAPCHWTGSNTYGGIFVWENRLFIPKGGKVMIPPAEILEARSGKILGEIDEWQALPMHQGMGAINRNCAQVGKWVFSNMKGDGAFRIDLSAAEPKFELIPEVRYARWAAAKDTAMAICQHRDEPVILAFQAETLEVLNRQPLESLEETIGDATELRAIDQETALVIAEKGIASIHLPSGRLNWTYVPSEPMDRWSGGLLVDGSFIVEEVRDTNPMFTEIDSISGEVLESLPSSELFLGKGFFAMGDRILVDATGSFLQFSRNASQTTLQEDIDFFEATTSSHPTPPPADTFTPTDKAYSAIITAFVNAKAAQEQGRETDHERLAAEFNRLFDAFTEAHPEAGIANVALTLSELGVPYEVALADVVRMRG